MEDEDEGLLPPNRVRRRLVFAPNQVSNPSRDLRMVLERLRREGVEFEGGVGAIEIEKLVLVCTTPIRLRPSNQPPEKEE